MPYFQYSGESRLPDDMYLEEAVDSCEEPLGYARYGRSSRGVCLTGSFREDPNKFESWEPE